MANRLHQGNSSRQGDSGAGAHWQKILSADLAGKSSLDSLSRRLAYDFVAAWEARVRVGAADRVGSSEMMLCFLDWVDSGLREAAVTHVSKWRFVL
jgi:hypothetical protein